MWYGWGMNNGEIWEITIVLTGGTQFKLCGTEDVLKLFADEWEKSQADITVDLDRTILTVDGYCDSADRAQQSLKLKASEIVAVTVMKMTY